MNLIIKGLLTALLLATTAVASAGHDIQVYTADNSKGKITGATIEKAFEAAGFFISGHNDMNVAFKGKFQTTNHKMYRLMTLYKKDLATELIKVSPRAALFTPLSMSIYMNKDSNNISVSSLSVDGMAKITGIPATNKHMIAYGELVKATLAKALPNGKFEKLAYQPVKAVGELVSTFSFDMEGTDAEAIEEELEGIQTEMEGSLETVGFVIAGFNKLSDDFEEVGFDKYDFFDAYSICKLPVIFQVAKKTPEAGALAPCTFYMYKEKGSETVTMEYPSVYNWLSSLSIKDEASLDVLKAAQKIMVQVVNETIE
mgnify:CR=1 FL=1